MNINYIYYFSESQTRGGWGYQNLGKSLKFVSYFKYDTPNLVFEGIWIGWFSILIQYILMFGVVISFKFKDWLEPINSLIISDKEKHLKLGLVHQ